MAFVVTDNCINCKYMDCIDVCPVDCFHEGPNFVVIDPNECIDCTLCEPECPASAIYKDTDVPYELAEFIELNSKISAQWPVVHERSITPKDAEEWDGMPNKIDLIVY